MVTQKINFVAMEGAWKELLDLLHDTTKPALVKEQQNHKKCSATALYLETSALKYQHELNSQNLQKHKAVDFEIHGFFFLSSSCHFGECSTCCRTKQIYWARLLVLMFSLPSGQA